MTINNMSVGKDYTLVFYDADRGQVVELGDVQNFAITAQKHDIVSSPYNADPRFGYIPAGYKFSFTITRTGSDLENLQLAANQRFDEGGSSRAGYLNETIRNQDGSFDRYQYTGFVFWLTDIGDVSRDKNVQLKAEGMASNKIRIA